MAKLIDRIHVDVEIRLRDKKVINSFEVSFFDDVFNLLMNFGQTFFLERFLYFFDLREI